MLLCLRRATTLACPMRKGFVTLEQYRSVLAELPEYLRGITCIAYHVGNRKGELFSLEWADVELEGDPVWSKYSCGAAIISKQTAEAFATADPAARRFRPRSREEEGISLALMVAFEMINAR